MRKKIAKVNSFWRSGTLWKEEGRRVFTGYDAKTQQRFREVYPDSEYPGSIDHLLGVVESSRNDNLKIKTERS